MRYADGAERCCCWRVPALQDALDSHLADSLVCCKQCLCMYKLSPGILQMLCMRPSAFHLCYEESSRGSGSTVQAHGSALQYNAADFPSPGLPADASQDTGTALAGSPEQRGGPSYAVLTRMGFNAPLGPVVGGAAGLDNQAVASGSPPSVAMGAWGAAASASASDPGLGQTITPPPQPRGAWGASSSAGGSAGAGTSAGASAQMPAIASAGAGGAWGAGKPSASVMSAAPGGLAAASGAAAVEGTAGGKRTGKSKKKGQKVRLMLSLACFLDHVRVCMLQIGSPG